MFTRRISNYAALTLVAPALLLGACQFVPPPPITRVHTSMATPITTPTSAMTETAEPAATPDAETPTPAPTSAPASTDELTTTTSTQLTVTDLVGRWSMDGVINYDLSADGTYTMAFSNVDQPTQEPRETGTWTIQADGTVELTSGGKSQLTSKIIGKTLLVSVSPRNDTQTFLRKVGPDNKPLPVEMGPSALSLPLFDAADAALTSQIQISTTWIGLSPFAPIVNQSTLTQTNGQFEGSAYLEAGGYRQGISDTVAISVPAEVMTAFLSALANTPVVSETYRPYFSHTDDYPHLEIRIGTGENAITFYTESQGATNIPWAVDVGGQRYVSYSEDIAAALSNIQPYLAKEAQDKLIDQLR